MLYFRIKFRVPEEQLLPKHQWKLAVWTFWENVLGMDPKNLLCESCGPFPEVLVADGVSIGMFIENLRGKENLFVPYNSPDVLQAPSFNDRNFIRQPSNRAILKKAAESGKFPLFRTANLSDDPGNIFVFAST